ncbi:prephenate/arogenate dehydrogenase family protein [Blastomonas aquatica]|uniref:prephenate/arogenate dehydrogenase family protein n=1 Tax=Blastomonas aquatica TaxID=1510276 RepID=UPI001E359DA3|nr:prephenate/arogenate dehydrogenase family protein [Blastomonas aquatica]
MESSAPFASVAIVGLGLIGSSIARAIRQSLPDTQIMGYDRNADVCARAQAIALCDSYHAAFGPELAEAELVILCVPVGAMAAAATAMAPHLSPETIISDVGSCKASVLTALRGALPYAIIVPAHPVAGTENSGPEAGFASLFKGRWCILTPDADSDAAAFERVAGFWRALGAEVETMDAAHHDLVLAVTSHLPHLIAYTIVGTASDLEGVTQSEVIKYSAGGFRDFTRIAASDPVMWRDVFLSNKDAVLEMLQRFSEDLSALQRAIRWGKGDELEALFTRTRTIRRSIIEQGQDDAKPDFGREHP